MAINATLLTNSLNMRLCYQPLTLLLGCMCPAPSRFEREPGSVPCLLAYGRARPFPVLTYEGNWDVTKRGRCVQYAERRIQAADSPISQAAANAGGLSPSARSTEA